MDKQLISLAFSMETNKGAYALLLGSGVSHPAGIPTGWGILEELCRQVMLVEKKKHNNPIQWYEEYFSQPPAYDEVIKSLANTSSDRVNLLKGFFEPNEHDDDNAKKPTIAHKKIAKLVKGGYIKVIVTTNFDRLMELALDELKVSYQTLYHDSDIDGLIPLAHANCTILKIHGDYMDTRFKNVSNELEKYSESLSNLLQRVFDEYGIITSGWSAEWDTALRDNIRAVEGRRYSWYWHAYNETLGEQAEALLKWRDGIKIVNSNGADSFFSLLSERVDRLSELKKSNLENIQTKINKLKKYITNGLEIELNEMITEETKLLVQFIKSLDFQSYSTSATLREYVEKIKEKSRTLSLMLTILTYYSRNERHEEIIIEALERLTTVKSQEVLPSFVCLSKLPAIIGLYSVGIAAVMKKNYKLLKKVFTEIKVSTNSHYPGAFLEFTGSYGISIAFRELYSKEQRHLLFEEMFMHPYMCEIYANSILTFDEQELNNYYDTFELLLTLKHRHLNSYRFLSGIFGYKDDMLYIANFLSAGGEEKENWQVLEMFDNNIENFKELLIDLTLYLSEETNQVPPLLSSYLDAIESHNF